jgi:hypothetical protein
MHVSNTVQLMGNLLYLGVLEASNG